MKDITKDLFYSEEENILFWIAGYTKDSNTNNVYQIIESLTENALKFSKQAGINVDEVLTYYNDRPPRYQYMRVFYTYVPKNIKGAFKLGKDWTMYKWLTT